MSNGEFLVIAESGSSKTDWILVNAKGQVLKESSSIGYNPYFVSSEDMVNDLKSHAFFEETKHLKANIHFYGAGCSNDKNIAVISDALNQLSPQSKIFVEHDLLAAARASYAGTPVISCILGTGSNCCYFDGLDIIQNTPSLGYVLGDEGAGSNIGKIFITEFLYGNCPEPISTAFIKEFGFSKEDILTSIYHEDQPNTYLAQFARFLAKHQNDEYVKVLIYTNFRRFIELHILSYREYFPCAISFVGSIAFHFKPLLEDALTEYGLELTKVMKSPKQGLLSYHTSNK